MLLSNIALKVSSYLASFSVMHGTVDPVEVKQSHIGLDSGSEFKADAGLMLSDILTVQTSASIFYSYARETHVGELLKQEGARITVFAPTNKAVMALARKPHQGPIPVDGGVIISEEEFDSRSRENVERWISAHIVPQHISNLLPSSKYEALLEGIVISVSSKSDAAESDKSDWANVLLNDEISVVGKSEAANGVLYLLDGALYG